MLHADFNKLNVRVLNEALGGWSMNFRVGTCLPHTKNFCPILSQTDSATKKTPGDSFLYDLKRSNNAIIVKSWNPRSIFEYCTAN